MTKREKRLQRVRQNPKNVTLEQLQAVLEDYGFVHARTAGSHYIFRYTLHGETKWYIVPYKRPLNVVYVRDALKIIERMIEEQGENG